MHQLIVLYRTPSDPAAFDTHYATVHTPMAAKLPGLKSFSVRRPQPAADGSPPDYHLVATLTFASGEALAQALTSPLGEQVQADLANFATAGAVVLSGPAATVTGASS